MSTEDFKDLQPQGPTPSLGTPQSVPESDDEAKDGAPFGESECVFE
jgi:hypothetical protein